MRHGGARGGVAAGSTARSTGQSTVRPPIPLAMPPERLPAARAEVQDVLAGFRQPDGALLVTREIRFTTARAR